MSEVAAGTRRAEEAPAIARFLDRFPVLREAALEVLARAEAIRRARSRAFRPDGDRGEPTATGADASELEAAVEVLEGLARDPTARSGDDEAALRRFGVAAARMRASRHVSSPRRATTSPEARLELVGALQGFHAAFETLTTAAWAAGVRRIPWQIELAPHADPARPVREIELDGYDLPGLPAARMAWGERCLLSPTQWVRDRHAGVRPSGDDQAPSPDLLRHRSLETWFHVLSPRVHDLVERTKRALEPLRRREARVVEELERALPILEEGFVAETSSPTFARLGLLDFPSLAVSLHNAFRAFARRPFLGRRAATPAGGEGDDGHGYVWHTYEEVGRDALRLARGLEVLGLDRGARLGILTRENCREFYLADFAACFGELVSVGLADTLPDERLLELADRAEIEALVVDRASAERFLRRPPPTLRFLVVFGAKGDAGGGGGRREVAPGLAIVALEDLLAEELPPGWRAASGISAESPILYDDVPGHQIAEEKGIASDGDEDLYTILFTSGSTGEPKGTPVTRRRWAEEMCSEIDLWPHVRVSFQPSAVAGDRTLVWRTLASGGRVGFARRGAGLWPDVRAIRPTIFSAPPVVWSSLYAEYRRAIADPGLSPAAAAAVRERFKSRLGGRVALLAIGGAPSDPGVRRAMEAIFGVPMTESYGTTETGNIAADGRLAAGLDYRLLDVPELGFRAAEGRGELAVRTPRTTRPQAGRGGGEAAAEYTDDGYFRTGDIVEVGPDRKLTIRGRRKHFFKLAGSEFVAPEALERVYLQSERVEAVLVTGSPLRSRVVALVVPARAGTASEEILADFQALARRAGLRPSETPAGVVVVPRVENRLPWTVGNGLLTATSKLNRQALEEKYRREIEEVYFRLEEGEAAATAESASPGDEALERLIRVAAAVLSRPAAEIDPGRSLVELGGDSLSGMDFVLRLEEVFGGKGERAFATLDPAHWVESSLRRLARSLQDAPTAAPVPASAPLAPTPLASRGRATATASASAEAERANADAALGFEMPDPFPEPATSRDVLVTGATGFLGVHLLVELGESLPADAALVAVVRAADDAAARRRLEEKLLQADLDAGALERVEVLAGSLERPRLGLAPDRYERLAAEVGLVHHVAARVDFSRRYDALREANVEGTRRILELATTSRSKAVHFVSSLNVAFLLRRMTGRAFEETPLPDRLAEEDVAASLGYTVSKWVAERVVQRAWADSGGALRVSISRPAMVAWSSRTGHANDDDWLCRMLESCLRLRAAIGPEIATVPRWVRETPTSTRGFDLVPVDIVARALVELGEATRRAALPLPTRAAPPHAPTLHVSSVTGPEAGLVTLSCLMDRLVAADAACRSKGPPMRYLPFADWATRVEIEGAPAVAALDQLRRTPPMDRTEAGRFAAAVRGTSAAPPAFDAAYVETWVRRRSG